MRGWRGGWRRSCRSTSTTKTASSVPTTRRRTSPRVGAPASCGCPRSTRRALPKRSGAPPRSATASPICNSPMPTACRSSTAAVVRQHLKLGAFVQSSAGVTLTDLDGNRFYDLTGSYGVNVFGYDFYKEAIARGVERVRELGPVLGAYHPGDRRQRTAAAGNLRSRRSIVPHVGHRGGDAGRAARALSHPPLPSGALLRGLSWLVGRRAAGHRQPGAGARDLYAQRTCPTIRCACCGRGATSPASSSIRCRRCIRMRRAGGFVAGRQLAQRPFRQGRLRRLAQAAAGGLLPSGTSS